MKRGKKKVDEEGTSISKRGRRLEKPGHLYLVLDDWSRGYSIRKIDLSFNDPRLQLIPEGHAPGSAIYTGRHRLPPASLRLIGFRGKPKSIVGAFGSKILAMQSISKRDVFSYFQVYDVRMRHFMLSPSFDTMVEPIYIPVGGRLFALSAKFCVLIDQPEYKYCWQVDQWLKLPMPTFLSCEVTSYAVHPDKQTIFLSVGRQDTPATFCFDTVKKKWMQPCQWRLPFIGHGYFDPELDAWVGLSCVTGTFGHLCSCDVVSNILDGTDQHCPALKISKEQLFSEVPVERHTGATLVYMGGGSRFCLLEFIHLQTDDGKHFLRLTTFTLKYDRIGDLTTGNSRCVRYYNLPQNVSEQMLEHPVAFWM